MEVASNLPKMFFIISLILLILMLIGIFLIKKVDLPEEWKMIERPNYNLREYLLTPHFLKMITMYYCSTLFGIYLVASYKNFGSQAGNIDDSFLTMTGSIASAMNGLFRIVWGKLLDHTNFRFTYSLLLSTQVIISFFIYYAVSLNKYLYMLMIILSYICYGGNFAIFPAYFAK